ncbi:protein adenylyltransferase SelO [Rhodomicrobium sp.]|uniref:protein adenylyltransferase SelO n=1 Tax=Rhodomicrobium sp. TaxID=2720632 RepID=UPI0039E535B8
METEHRDFFPCDNSYARLPQRFYAKLPPVRVAAPRLVRLNEDLARQLNLDPAALSTIEGVAALSGNRVPQRCEPLAMAYAGHQFGMFVPQLGDGRAILLGEVIDRDGVRRDIQLKGSGRTPFSRGGDGRAALGPVLREYIVSEAMAALGVPTTRSLAAVTTGETVARVRPLPGAVLTRVASSHVRVGTFQFFAARGDVEATRCLADYVIARHYPEAAGAENPYLALLGLVCGRQAELIAKWMLIGFIHGVMNTDNVSIAGETIDYGPCAFMDAYHPDTVFSSIDHGGRYAYGNQPRVAQWNLARLAEALLPLIAEDKATAIEGAQEALTIFAARFDAAYIDGIRRKLGLLRSEPEDISLADDLLKRMAANGADFTLTFRGLCDTASGVPAHETARLQFADPSVFDEWAARWRERLAREATEPAERRAVMRSANPAFIPRNHLVEEAIDAAQDKGNFAPFETLLTVLAKPYEDFPEFARYAAAPRPDQVVHQTFCGT